MASENTATAITWWAIVSAFGGAIIGGGISYILQRMNLLAAKKQREEDRMHVREALAYSLLFKLISIVSHLHHIQTAIKEMFAEANAAGFKGEPWNIMRPIFPIPESINFKPEEMALILSMDDKTFNEIASLDDIHNSTVRVLELHNSKRHAIMERFGAEMTGNIGTTNMTHEQAQWMAPRAVELNDIVNSIVDRIDRDTEAAKAGLKNLHNVLEKELKLKKKLEFVET